MPIQDPDNSKKQVFKGITYPNQPLIKVYDLVADFSGLKSQKGTMVYCKADGGKLHI